MVLISNARITNRISFSANGSAIVLELLNSSVFLYCFIVPMVLFALVSDFKWGTLKNIVSFSCSRDQIYLAKYIFAGFISALLPVVFSLMGLVVNQLFNGFSGTFRLTDFVKMAKIIGLQTPILIGLAGAFLLAGTLFQRGTGVVLFAICYQLVPFMLVPKINEKLYSLIFKFEPITCLNLTSAFERLGISDILTILTSGAGLTLLTLTSGLMIFRKKRIR